MPRGETNCKSFSFARVLGVALAKQAPLAGALTKHRNARQGSRRIPRHAVPFAHDSSVQMQLFDLRLPPAILPASLTHGDHPLPVRVRHRSFAREEMPISASQPTIHFLRVTVSAFEDAGPWRGAALSSSYLCWTVLNDVARGLSAGSSHVVTAAACHLNLDGI